MERSSAKRIEKKQRILTGINLNDISLDRHEISLEMVVFICQMLHNPFVVGLLAVFLFFLLSTF